ncbi:hypothetical protein PVL29_013838 [Vitis rotundifolia]|uniref:Ferredoxin thioredoxin reductase alpha chain domain-containing protein n=1 Tax=Vitis rotundifolia TaxID=103349 RepID=A0AA39DQ94_VITRO|nr:hypothetical protein PVL29_013838 [Vitis rotundifolia]
MNALAFFSASSPLNLRRSTNALVSSSSSSSSSSSLDVCSVKSPSFAVVHRRRRTISCEVALRSDSATSSSSAAFEQVQEDTAEEAGKIGARVRVKVPLKVFHVPRVPEVDLTGREGVLKQYVGVWKGKRISANLPFKIEFVADIEGRGPVKFFAHLKDDEFEYVDDP